MLMHEWIRYRNQKIKTRLDSEATETVEEPQEKAHVEERSVEPPTEAPASEEVLPTEEPVTTAATSDAPSAADADEGTTAVTEPVEPKTPAQAAPVRAEDTDRDREEVLSSLHEELERAGAGIRERLRQLQARQKQLPISVEEAPASEDEERPRRTSETRQELVQRLLDPTLTLREAALLLDVCPTTVRRYTNRGLLNCFRTPGNQRRFHLSDILEFMERRERGEL